MAMTAEQLASLYALAGGQTAVPAAQPAMQDPQALLMLQYQQQVQQALMLQMQQMQSAAALPQASAVQLQLQQMQSAATQPAQSFALAASSAPSQPNTQTDAGKGGGGGRPHRLPEDYTIIGEKTGQVHAWDDEKGFGFMTCEELRDEYGKDPFILRSQLNDCKVGDVVSFTAVMSGKGQVQAWALSYIKDGEAPQPRQKKGEGKSKGDKGDKGDKGGKGKGKGKGQKGEDIGEYQGMVKGTNEAGHCFMICEKLLEEGWQGDVLLQPEENVGYEFGDTISFTAFQNGQGKLGAKNASFVSSSYIGAYVGTVKSYNEANGYGFIACDETKELGHADVFLHAKHSDCETARQGDKVSFQAYTNLKGQLQAKKVQVIESMSPTPKVVPHPLGIKRGASEAGLDSWGGDDQGKGKFGKGNGSAPARNVPAGVALMLANRVAAGEDLAAGADDPMANPAEPVEEAWKGDGKGDTADWKGAGKGDKYDWSCGKGDKGDWKGAGKGDKYDWSCGKGDKGDWKGAGKGDKYDWSCGKGDKGDWKGSGKGEEPFPGAWKGSGKGDKGDWKGFGKGDEGDWKGCGKGDKGDWKGLGKGDKGDWKGSGKGDKGASKGGWPDSSWTAGGDDSSWGGASAGADWQSAAIQAGMQKAMSWMSSAGW